MGISQRLQELVRKRDGYRCAYCRTPEALTVTVFEIDHIIPKSQGGETHESNLCLACPTCNRYKGISKTAMDPESGEEVPLFHPRQDRWEDHFAWNHEKTLIEGLTPTGRATIEKLKMNRLQMVRIRGLWRKIGIDLDASFSDLSE
ncbi:MAG TPA: HNH endonuclease [Anaerolineae bacterium]|nr:HNH endonuclease [Anaerolineae bacterium]